MGLRLHKSIKIAQGVRLNLSKSGPSISLGGKGVSFNLGGNRSRATLGIPGSGISYSTSKKNGKGLKSMFWLAITIGAIVLANNYFNN